MDILQEYKGKPLYEVPENYFEQFSNDIINRVNKEKQLKKTKKWISVISVAASLTGIVFLSNFIFVNQNTDEHFYVQANTPSDKSTLLQDSDYVIKNDDKSDLKEDVSNIKEPIEINQSSVNKETIVYRAVDFYVDDYETNNFCEVMYELECDYDY